MYEILKSPLAKADLLDIWLYSFEKWGERTATDYLLQLDKAIQSLTSKPKRGKTRDTLRQGYRFIQVNRHLVYYRVQGKTIDIVRVLHERMLPQKHL